MVSIYGNHDGEAVDLSIALGETGGKRKIKIGYDNPKAG